MANPGDIPSETQGGQGTRPGAALGANATEADAAPSAIPALHADQITDLDPGAVTDRNIDRVIEASQLKTAADRADPSGRLAVYMARTQNPLNLLALCTVWLVVVRPSDFGEASAYVFGLRIGLSVIYAIDMAIRATLAQRHLRYLVINPIGVAAVLVPPVRVVLSLRLVHSVFRRGHLVRFLAAASALVLNGAAVVYLYESHAAGSNIHTFGESLWWSLVTVTTVGYGDFYPVTTAGRIAAVVIMLIGILTLAVVTANVASSFLQSAVKAGNRAAGDRPVGSESVEGGVGAAPGREGGVGAAPGREGGVTATSASSGAAGTSMPELAALTERLVRIEAMLQDLQASERVRVEAESLGGSEG